MDMLRIIPALLPGADELGAVISAALLPVAGFQDRPELDELRSFWSDDARA